MDILYFYVLQHTVSEPQFTPPAPAEIKIGMETVVLNTNITSNITSTTSAATATGLWYTCAVLSKY